MQVMNQHGLFLILGPNLKIYTTEKVKAISTGMEVSILMLTFPYLVATQESEFTLAQ